MTNEELERQLRAWYLKEVPATERAPIALRSSLAGISRRSGSLRSWTASRNTRLLAVAALLTALVGGAVAVGVGWRPPDDAIVTGPSVSPTYVAVATGPSVSPTHVACAPPPVPTWGPDAEVRDWPGPVRDEPPGGAADLPESQVIVDHRRIEPDTRGELEADTPWVDIVTLELQSGTHLWMGLAGAAPTGLDRPGDRWVAYGVVLDLDGDGTPDQRVGGDNARAGMDKVPPLHREWVTDLHTGKTIVNPGPGFGYRGLGTYFETWLVGEGKHAAGDEAAYARLAVDRVTETPTPLRFYAWASTIEDGCLITDFAPDAGWLTGPQGFLNE